MGRDITAASLTAITSAQTTGTSLIYVDFPDNEVRASLLPIGMDVDWDGHTWRGLGEYAAVDGISETSDLSVGDISMTLSGVVPATISTALSLNYQGREFIVYNAFFDNDMQLIADPFVVARGLVNNMAIQLGEEGVVTLTGTTRAMDMNRPREKRRNNETHQQKHPGDTFYNKVEDTARVELRWGSGLLKNGRPAIVN